MKKILSLLIVTLVAVSIQAQTGDLPRSTPAQQGLSTLAVNQFVDSLMALPETEVHHVMVLRHGHVVAEVHPAPFRDQDAHTLYSASKTFVALAVGLAISDNRLRLNDRVAAIMHDQLPDTVSAALAQMTIDNLLTMSSGIKPDWTMRNNVDNWLRTWLAYPVGEPGQHLFYDSMSTYMLSAIVQRVMGKTVLQLLDERLFTPRSTGNSAPRASTLADGGCAYRPSRWPRWDNSCCNGDNGKADNWCPRSGLTS